MKALHQFSTADSAKLLNELFPDEIPVFLEFVWNLCATIREGEDRNRAAWNDQEYPFETFFRSLVLVENTIASNLKQVALNADSFASQLFTADSALFMEYCFQLYTKVKQHPNPKFTLAINLLFN